MVFNVNTIGPIVDRMPPPLVPGEKTTVHVRGMLGLGDCVFERAVLRELMRHHNVLLDTYYGDMYHDLIALGMRTNVIRDRGRIRDDTNRTAPSRKGIEPVQPRRGEVRLTYGPDMIRKHGSILASIFASAGLTMPERPDFSLPVKPEWKEAWREKLEHECRVKGVHLPTKPVAVYRPIVLNGAWTAPARSPDPEAYAAIFSSIRDKFFWVSVADVREKNGGGYAEWIVGRRQEVDLSLEHGELDFKTLCGLFSSSFLVYGNPGFTPVLSQAVGTPTIIVYGANESYRTTNIVGSHLAPTLAIDIDRPCEHHLQNCKCPKTITIEPAIRRVVQFAEAMLKEEDAEFARRLIEKDKAEQAKEKHKTKPRVLIFGTVYSDTPEREALTRLWHGHHSKLNPDCDLLLVDSASPEWPWQLLPIDLKVHAFPDNIGHLSRNGPSGPKSGGRDGWGRAFCKGLELAIEGKYDYVVHIEGDSLFKWPVMPIVERMTDERIDVLTTAVMGTKNLESNWVETGLMFFNTCYVAASRFIERYDWANRKATPTPEKAIWAMIEEDAKKVSAGSFFTLEKWAALRGDKNQINSGNITQLDWVTHVRNKVGLDDIGLFELFSKASMEAKRMADEAPKITPAPEAPAAIAPSGADATSPGGSEGRLPAAIIDPGPPVTIDNKSPKHRVATIGPIRDRHLVTATAIPQSRVPSGVPKPVAAADGRVKINLGCGTNRLEGWNNYDAEVNINARLPFADNSADFIFAEHVAEHTTYYRALAFFEDAARVLRPGGVLRVTVPSLEQIYKFCPEDYIDFIHKKGWSPTRDVRGTLHAITHKHGHQTAWSAGLLEASLYLSGFKRPTKCSIGASAYNELRGIEGHGRVIGDRFNEVESVSVEAEVDK